MPILTLLRPIEWAKNALVLMPLFFSQKLTDPLALKPALIAFAVFCLLSSGVYAFNDAVDARKDRQHPVKKKRPVASSKLLPLTAFGVALALWALGLLMSWKLPDLFLAVGFGFIANGAAYTLFFKRVALLDVFSSVFGYFMRLAAGAAAIGVGVSRWSIAVVLALGLLLAFGKRRVEVEADGTAASTLYSKAFLDQCVTLSAAFFLAAYVFYAVSPETIEKFRTDRLLFTVPFAAYAVFRYLMLIHKDRAREGSLRMLVTDFSSVFNVCAYLVVAFTVLYHA